jgi:hypothetical protein
VWLDGRRVFERSDGSSASVEVPAKRTAVRVWVVFREGEHERVFDTNAVVLPGQIYNVGEGRFAAVTGGGRRECIRVSGQLLTEQGDKQPLRWRELGTPPGPLMGTNESFRPSGAQDRREIGVVDKDLFAARVPPLPLVHSYTHPGTYEWSVSPKGEVSLRLMDDLKLCAEGDAAAP